MVYGGSLGLARPDYQRPPRPLTRFLVPLNESAGPRQAEAHSCMLYCASTFGLRGPLGPLGTLVVGPRSRKRPQHRRRLRHGDSPLEPSSPCR